VTPAKKTPSAEFRAGDMVLAAGVKHDQNAGGDTAPAVVVEVLGEDCVAVRVLCNGPDVPWWPAVRVFAGPAEYEAAREEFFAAAAEHKDVEPPDGMVYVPLTRQFIGVYPLAG